MLVLVRSRITKRLYEPIGVRNGLITLCDVFTAQTHCVDQSELARWYEEEKNVEPRRA